VISIRRYIVRERIRFSFEWDNYPKIDSDWDASASHYVVTLRKAGRRLTVHWHQGSGISHDPRLDDVLDSLASDASGVENARDFEDWASDYGYDTDSRKAEDIYRAVVKQTAGLKRLLGDEAYKALLWETERL